MKTDVLTRLTEARKLLAKAEDLLYEATNVLVNTSSAKPSSRSYLSSLRRDVRYIVQSIEKHSWAHLEDLMRYDELPTSEPTPEQAKEENR